MPSPTHSFLGALLVATSGLLVSCGGSNGTASGAFSSDYDGPVITGDDWFWVDPLPQGYSLGGIWGTDAEHLWAVGESGTILFSNGRAWETQLVEPVFDRFADVWGTDTRHVWAVGSAVSGAAIAFWNGAHWRSQDADVRSLASIWGSDTNHIWAVGENIQFFDGHRWRTQETPGATGFVCVSGSDASHVWAVNEDAVFFCDGRRWQQQFADPNTSFSSIWVADPQHVWALSCYWEPGTGSRQRLWFFDGRQWAPDSTDGECVPPWFLGGVDAEHVWWTADDQTLHFWNGREWTDQHFAGAGSIDALWAKDAHHVWAVGSGGAVAFFDGANWSSLSHRLPWGLDRIGGADERHVWVGGFRGLWFWDGAIWSEQSFEGAQEVREDKSRSASQDCADCDPLEWKRIWAADADHAWAVGTEKQQGIIAGLRDGHWVEQLRLEDARSCYEVAGTDPQHVWALAEGGLIEFFDGRTWSVSFQDPSFALAQIHAFDPTHVWVVGAELEWNPYEESYDYYGAIFAWDGDHWTRGASPAHGSLNAIWGSDLDHVWVVGVSDFDEWGSTLDTYFWDGNTWQIQQDAHDIGISRLRGTDANHVWGVDSRGVLFFDGASWTRQQSPVSDLGLADLWCSRDFVWATGTGVITKHAAR